MKLNEVYIKAKVICRLNRFLAKILLEDEREVFAHVPDPGRLKELFLPNAELAVRKEKRKSRKTAFTVVGIKIGEVWVNIESIFTNKIFQEEFDKLEEFAKYKIVRSEYIFGNSRFDFLLEHKKSQKQTLVEIKGVTLVQEGVALFPDAPTKRGAKHLAELKEAINQKYEAIIVFIIKRKDAKTFEIHRNMDPIFNQKLIQAQEKGVKVIILLTEYIPFEKNELNYLKSLEFGVN